MFSQKLACIFRPQAIFLAGTVGLTLFYTQGSVENRDWFKTILLRLAWNKKIAGFLSIFGFLCQL